MSTFAVTATEQCSRMMQHTTTSCDNQLQLADRRRDATFGRTRSSSRHQAPLPGGRIERACVCSALACGISSDNIFPLISTFFCSLPDLVSMLSTPFLELIEVSNTTIFKALPAAWVVPSFSSVQVRWKPRECFFHRTCLTNHHPLLPANFDFAVQHLAATAGAAVRPMSEGH